MPQDSVAYAVARVHYRMRDMLTDASLERVLSAPSYDEALRALAEIGWLEPGAADVEAAVTKRVKEACALVKAISPCPDATDCFLLRYDGLNLKMLIKARCRLKPVENLSDCGVYPPALLRHAVAERSYTALPDTLREALAALERSLAVKVDPLLIDTAIDQALFSLIALKLEKVDSLAIRRYFTGRADMLNAIMLLRVKRMDKGAAFVRDKALPGGSVAPEAWAEAYDRPEMVPKLLKPYGVEGAAALAAQNAKALPTLEKAMDDALLRPFSQLRYNPLRIEPVAGYLLGAIREAAAVRLILSGKKNGFSREAIEERLRDLYGG